MVKYYNIKEPIKHGTYPSYYHIVEVKNFDEYKYCPEIEGKAWGYVEYVNVIPVEVAEKYGLIREKKCCEVCGKKVDPQTDMFPNWLPIWGEAGTNDDGTTKYCRDFALLDLCEECRDEYRKVVDKYFGKIYQDYVGISADEQFRIRVVKDDNAK